MKTIKQIADELGVSKTAVRKKIENLGLRSSLRKNGNQFLIDEVQESLIKQGFLENKEHKIENLGLRSGLRKNGNQFPFDETQESFIRQGFLEDEAHQKHISDAENEAVIDLLRAELEVLHEQLREKDRQLEKAHQLIEHEQQLRMVTEQKYLMLEQGQEEPDSGTEKKWWQFWK